MSVTHPQGFRAAGVAAGLKSSGGPDVALVVNDGPEHVGAAVFTTNRCKAHPVRWSEQVVRDGVVRAVVLNAGGANCFTGPEGFQTTHATAEAVAEGLGISAGDVVVCSTGIIGQQLDRDKVIAGVTQAVRQLCVDGGEAAATAILTTDTRTKQDVSFGYEGIEAIEMDTPAGWSVGGMAKGAGMLAPHLATMLVVLTTDAVVDVTTAERALGEATRRSFDRIDTDGCMSTNDTVVLLSSGASGITPEYDDFARAVGALCNRLARKLVADAEGAEHKIDILVTGAASEDDALEVARAIARNNLVKCAIFGKDPYWGRILAAIGTTGAAFDPDDLIVAINNVVVCRNSLPVPGATVEITDRQVPIVVSLNAGLETAAILTSDLTHAYVTENSAYPT